MRTTTKILLFLLCLTLSFAAGVSIARTDTSPLSARDQPAPVPAVPAYLPGQQSMVQLDFERARCSGVVVGKHTILTATHCFEAGKVLTGVDGVPTTGRIIANDGHDHVIVRVSRELVGKRVAKVKALPAPGTDLYFWGCPSDLRTILRKGYVAGLWRSDDGTDFTVIEMHTWHGDSGGAFFDADHNVVAILYGGYSESRGSEYWDITIVQPFAFQPHQLRDLS